ncbi:MAG: hypothetical protein NUV77_23535 [Thermoguttaceae bacterium]|jgi:trk system potassium uptake protein TrkH|nr:hypothetical protein [Thermoguttaceae bacterium]
MPEIAGSVARYPARASFAWYFGLILLGALALIHPRCGVEGKRPISFLDALFTSTSATCVTGLTVRATGSEFSPLGQLVILALIQLGGIGIMTVTTFITFRLGGREGLRQRAVLAETFGAGPTTDLRWLLRNVILLTLAIEAVGAAVLAVRNLFFMPLPQALWHATFHAISAFCNAGFALSDDNLVGLQGDVATNLTIMGLVVLGGIGYPVMLDLQANWRGSWSRRWERLHLHTKLMLLGTAGLLVAGTLAFLTLEWDHALRGMPLWRKLLVSAFHAVVPRTAGFNTVDIGALTQATLFILVLLMFVGAGPCSTGGGLKVSTFVVLLLRAWKTFWGFRRVNVFRRTIPPESIARATTAAILFVTVVIAAVLPLTIFEHPYPAGNTSERIFLDALFEVVSALCTVGLSTGITPYLSAIGQIVLIVVMFVGRLGPITVLAAISLAERRQALEYPQEEPLIG